VKLLQFLRNWINSRNRCVICEEKGAILPLDDGTWICEDCAQYMNDLGNELEVAARKEDVTKAKLI